MSQKVEKPVLSGQRIKTRKRDEKERFDPFGFRDAIISGLDKCANDFEAISRYLDSAGNKLDYRRYGEALFDILIAGGILVPGGSISQEGDGPYKTDASIFNTSDEINMEEMKNWEQVFIKLMRRYKYLEKIFQDEIKKILIFVKYFKETERKKLCAMLSLWISNGSVPFQAILALNNSHLVKDNLALDFLIDLFKYWRQERGIQSLYTSIKKSNLEQHLNSFIPDTKQSQVYFRKAFEDNGLDEILKLYEDQHQQVAKKFDRYTMESLNPNEVLKFLEFVNDLKHLPRRGWIFSEIADHEQIAGHMYAMGIMTFLLGNHSNLDRLKCLQLSLVHDMAESIVGDITPHDNVPEEEKHQQEDEAMKQITSHLGCDIGAQIYNLYKEYEAKETPEAKFVKDLDRFDLLFTARQYEKRDKVPLKCQEYFDSLEGKFEHPYIQKLVEALNKERADASQLNGEVDVNKLNCEVEPVEK